MYKRWKQCFNEEPHGEHEWFYFWPRCCEGVAPDVEATISKEFWENPVVHKHHLKLTKWSWPGHAPWGQYDQICKITFTCIDDTCDFEYEMYRGQYDRLVLGHQPKEYGHWQT